MKNTLALLLITLFMGTCLNAQVKIGDNPQNIDPSSVLELESTDKVLVITRVTTAQMNAIVPIQGALCYNTEVQAVHYYDGTLWLNIGSGGGTGGPLTADPIVNPMSTIVITTTATGDNLEVAPNSISSAQIIDGGVNGIDIQDGSIGPGKLQNNSVTEEKLSENSVGAFALDNDNIGVSAFNNDAGYITAGDLDSSVSADANNAIVAGTDGGAYYDDTDLMNDVLDNATAIAADDDQSSANEIQSPTLTGTEIGLSGTAGTIDIGPLLSGGGSDNQNIGPLSLNAVNILSIGIEDGMANTVDLSALAGGTADGSETIVTAGTNTTVTGDGTTATPYIINSTGGGSGDGSETIINTSPTVTVSGTGTTLDPYTLTSSGGADGSETVINTSPTVTVAGTGTTLDPYILTSSGGADGSETVIDATNSTISVTGTGTMIDPYVLTSSAANVAFTPAGNTISTDVQNAIVELQDDIDGISAGGEVNTASNQGTGGVGLVLTKNVADLPFKSINAGPSGILSVTDDTAENEIEIDFIPATPLGIPSDQILITNSTTNQLEWVPRGAHTGAQKAIFYADEITGLPTTADDNINAFDDGGFYWDTDARSLGGFTFGALFVGLEPGNTQSNSAKVHIADNFPGLTYALHLHNFSGNPARTTGILFSTVNAGYGKGSLIFDSQAPNGLGDFHFLQNNTADTSLPVIADKAFTVKNNKDIVVYGGIEIDGTREGLTTGIGTGTAGQVLTSTGTGVQWTAKGGGTSPTDTDANDGLSTFVPATGYDINFDDATIEVFGDALRVKTDGITSNEIGDGTIDNIDIAADAITSDKIGLGEVTTSDLENSAVTPLKIEASITNGEVLLTSGGAVVWGSVPAGAVSSDGTTITGNGSTTDLSVPTGGITTNEIFDSTIANADLGADAITTDKILNGEIQTLDLEDSAVTPLKIEASITNGEVLLTSGGIVVWGSVPAGAVSSDGTTITGNGSTTDLSVITGGINTAQLAADAVTAVKIADGAITGGAGGVIADNSITASDIDDDAVDSAEIRIDAVGLSEIQTAAVASDEIVDGSIANIDIATGAAIDGTKVNPNFGAQNITTTGDITTTGTVDTGIIVVAGTQEHPDYVFEKYFLGSSELKTEYDFISLEEIESFVKKYHHLPGIKSAAAVKKEGKWNLGESNIQNLEKIEELFLHTIEQEKKIKTLKSDKEKLRHELEQIKKDIEEIKALLKG